MKINLETCHIKLKLFFFYFWLYGSYFLSSVSFFHFLFSLIIFSSIYNIFNQALVISYQNQKNRQRSKGKERGFLILCTSTPFSYHEFLTLGKNKRDTKPNERRLEIPRWNLKRPVKLLSDHLILFVLWLFLISFEIGRRIRTGEKKWLRLRN